MDHPWINWSLQTTLGLLVILAFSFHGWRIAVDLSFLHFPAMLETMIVC
jgi:hypothetical protein